MAWPVIAALMLNACAAPPPRAGGAGEPEALYEQRADRLASLAEWVLHGRLAVRDDSEGGSGSIVWRRSGASSRMDFHGALGRGAWRLEAGESGAELQFADGKRYSADSAEALFRRQVGWHLPADALGWWVRGVAAPGAFQELRLDQSGRPEYLEQDGWIIEFERYGAVGEVFLPFRMTARRDEYRVKLAVRKWELPAPQRSDVP